MKTTKDHFQFAEESPARGTKRKHEDDNDG